jgi:hypothetical protein
MVVSLGPLGIIVDNIPKNPRQDGLGANPRCLRRDVNRNSALGATANYTMNLITQNPQIDAFYNRYLGQPQLKNDNHPWGVRYSQAHLDFLVTGLTQIYSFTTPATTLSVATQVAYVLSPSPQPLSALKY